MVRKKDRKGQNLSVPELRVLTPDPSLSISQAAPEKKSWRFADGTNAARVTDDPCWWCDGPESMWGSTES